MAAILEATIRVLDEGSGEDLTTTRVSEVAGVSVGTLYQYFPNREALINALLADHLDAAVSAVERESLATADLPREVAIERVIRAFLGEKAERANTSRILNKAFGIGMLDDRPLVQAAGHRAHVAVARLISGGEPDEASIARAKLGCDALEGMVRGVVSTDPAQLADPAWIEQVVRISLAAL